MDAAWMRAVTTATKCRAITAACVRANQPFTAVGAAGPLHSVRPPDLMPHSPGPTGGSSRPAFLFPPSLGAVTTSARAELVSEWLQRHFPAVAGDVRVATDYEDLERCIQARSAVLAWAPPYVCARVGYVARGVFRAVRGGIDTYRAALVCRSSEPLTLGTLAGKRAAWVAPRSEAGYRVPRELMARSGVDPDAVLADQRFVGSYRAALRCVLDGEADIAGVFARDSTPEAVADSVERSSGPRARHRLEVVAFSDPLPNDALLVLRDETEGGVAVNELADALGASAASLLLGVLDADRLVPATSADYASLV